MPAGSTYTPIATQTISGSTTASATFSSIAGSYTDLVLVVAGTATVSTIDFLLRFNGDTGSNYSRTYLYGSGSAALSGRTANATSLGLLSLDTNQQVNIVNIFNYSNATTYKTAISRINGAVGYGTSAIVGTWRNTAAITSLSVTATTSYFGSGTTLTLYGIAAA